MDAKSILKEHVLKITSLSDAEFDYFFSHFKSESFKKGQVIITEGQEVDKEYFVVSGCLKAFFLTDEIKMYILQFSMPTWWTSDYAALYNKIRSTISIDCISDVEVLSLTNSDREKICRELHKAEYFFRWRTNKGYVAMQKKLLSFMNNDTKTRYEQLLALYPALYNMVPKHLIAAYLGVSRETLSRLYNSSK
jgi:CRP-like cAMP-binding protein